MRIKLFLVLFIIGGFLKIVSAQTGTIIGVIYDSKTNETLIGVSIINESGEGVASNLEGKFDST